VRSYFCEFNMNSKWNYRIPHPTPRHLSILLSTYHLHSVEIAFSLTSFHCALCLTCKRGSLCIQLSCQHVFCRECLFDFWNGCILEGNVERVLCPDPNCSRKGVQISEEDLFKVVGDGLLHRWKWLNEKRALEQGACYHTTAGDYS
jgi:E3 ubiquitin-protein ligase RNF14